MICSPGCLDAKFKNDLIWSVNGISLLWNGFPRGARYLFRGDLLLLNIAIMSSAVSSPFFTFCTAVRNAKPSLGSESIKRLRSNIGSRVSYCLRSSSDHSKRRPALPRLGGGNRLPSSMSERKGDEMPIFFANARKDKFALSRNSWIRWPKEISIMSCLW